MWKLLHGRGSTVRFSTEHRLAGLVVKASPSRAEDPWFESRLRREFSGSSHTSDLKIGTPVATLQCQIFQFYLCTHLLTSNIAVLPLYKQMTVKLCSVTSVHKVQWKFALLVGCLTSQQHASLSQGRICSDNFTCCYTETEVRRANFLPHPVTVY